MVCLAVAFRHRTDEGDAVANDANIGAEPGIRCRRRRVRLRMRRQIACLGEGGVSAGLPWREVFAWGCILFDRDDVDGFITRTPREWDLPPLEYSSVRSRSRRRPLFVGTPSAKLTWSSFIPSLPHAHQRPSTSLLANAGKLMRISMKKTSFAINFNDPSAENAPIGTASLEESLRLRWRSAQSHRAAHPSATGALGGRHRRSSASR